MTCIHCSGNHYSDYCAGYNSDSMNKSLSEVTQGIDELSALNEEALEQSAEYYEAMLENNERIIESNQRISDDITKAGYDISDAINASTIVNAQGYQKISNSIDEGAGIVAGATMAAGFMINSTLIGIGAILQYRERMEQLRHKERLSFDEEKSDAGRARRELKTASTLLFVGDPKQAENYIKNSLRLFPSSAETFRLRGIIESRQDRHSEAVISLKAALKLAEDNHFFPVLFNLDNSTIDELFESVITSSLAQLSQELALTGKLNDAIDYLSDGVKMFPDNSDLQFQRVRVSR